MGKFSECLFFPSKLHLSDDTTIDTTIDTTEMTTMKREQQDDSAPSAKKVRYDDEDVPVLGDPQELSFLDQVKSYFDADGADYSQVLLSLIRVEDQRNDILHFLEKPVICDSVAVKMDAFLDDNGRTWATHDVDMDESWTNVVGQLQGAGLGDSYVSELSKPSGPRKAALCCLWHYPTFSTRKPEFGMTLDKTNCCLAYQWKKIADNSKASTRRLLFFVHSLLCIASAT